MLKTRRAHAMQQRWNSQTAKTSLWFECPGLRTHDEHLTTGATRLMTGQRMLTTGLRGLMTPFSVLTPYPHARSGGSGFSVIMLSSCASASATTLIHSPKAEN